MRFKQFRKPQIQEDQDLFEVKMSLPNLKQLVDKIDALAGLEFEMIVPDVTDNSDNSDDLRPQANYDFDESTYNIDQICDFFDDGDFNSRRDINRLRMDLESDFQTWADSQFDSNWENNKEEFIYEYLVNKVDGEYIAEILGLDPEEVDGFTKAQLYTAVELVLDAKGNLYNLAYNYHRDQLMEQDDLEEQWLNDAGLDNMTDINSRYSIYWPHYRYPESDPEVNMDAIAQSFSKAVGKEVKTSSSYGSAKREADKYIIEPDGSLRPGRDDDQGLEFVSPPLTIPKMLEDLKEVIAWAKSTGCYTNSSTGLHMNVSVPGYSESNLDFVKLTLLIGDKYVLDQFGRSANIYCSSALEKINERLKDIQPADKAKILEQLRTGLNKLASRAIQTAMVSKYTSIHPQRNRVEFRSPGGDWLNEDLDKLTTTLLRFVVGLDAAVDPDKYKEEYYKKFYKLVQPAFEQDNELHKVLSLYVSGDKEEALSKAKTIRIQRQARKGSLPGQKYSWKVMRRKDVGNENYYSIVIDADTEEEAKKTALQSESKWRMQFLSPDDLVATPIGLATTETGNAYTIQRLRAIGGNETVHTFQAPSRTEADRMASEYLTQRRLDPLDYVVVRQYRSDDTQRETYTIYDTQDGYNIASIQARSLADAIQQFQQRITAETGIYSNPERYQLRDRNGQVVYPESSTSTQSEPGGRTPMRYTNPTGRESNPQGQYVIMMSYDDPPLYRFNAANLADAQAVLRQWQEANPEVEDRMDFELDPNMLFGQPATPQAIPGSTIDRARRRAAAAQTDSSTSNNRLWQIVDSADGEVAYEFYLSRENNQQDANEVGLRWVRNNGDPNTSYSVREQPPSTGTIRPNQTPQANSDPILAAPESDPDANWAIVRNSDDAIIAYFTRNTPAEAEADFNTWLYSLGSDTNIRTYYRLEPVRPRSSSSSTRTTDPSNISGWRIVLANGEEVHRGTNTGISQQEAESRAASWLYNNGYGVLSSAAGEYTVEPIRPISRGQENTRPEPETTNWTARNQLWRILLNGEEVHNFWNTNVQSDANQAAHAWILNNIRRGLLRPEESAEIEVVPVRS